MIASYPNLSNQVFALTRNIQYLGQPARWLIFTQVWSEYSKKLVKFSPLLIGFYVTIQ